MDELAHLRWFPLIEANQGLFSLLALVSAFLFAAFEYARARSERRQRERDAAVVGVYALDPVRTQLLEALETGEISNPRRFVEDSKAAEITFNALSQSTQGGGMLAVTFLSIARQLHDFTENLPRVTDGFRSIDEQYEFLKKR
jgi:hypothetical protein